MFEFKDLLSVGHRPEPYTPGAELWNDAHISKEMLSLHLSPDTDAASYRPKTISAICEYLVKAMHLRPKDAVLDLGCGPGLYCRQLFQYGLTVTGIDRSENSIRYAKEKDGDTEYILADYLKPFGSEIFDAVIMVSQDYVSPVRKTGKYYCETSVMH